MELENIAKNNGNIERYYIITHSQNPLENSSENQISLLENENVEFQELEDQVEMTDGDCTNSNYSTWTKKASKALIHTYKKFRSKVGSYEMRNLKKMWEVISRYLSEQFQLHYTPTNCENRWRVLERNYKKYIDNNNKTGRGRKHFEFADEMDDIFSKKRNINPEILLSSKDMIKNNTAVESVPSTSIANESEEKDYINTTEQTASTENSNKLNMTGTTRSQINSKKRRVIKSRANVLEEIRNDRLIYQSQLLRLQEKRYQEKTDIEKEKLNETRRKNDLFERRNQLLEEILKKGSTDVPFSLL